MGATTNDAAIPQTVALKQMSLQARSGASAGSSTVYMHVYDAFEVNSALPPASVGNLIAVSTNAVDLSAASELDELVWYFDNDEIDKGTEYFYVIATTTSPATSGDTGNLSVGGFETVTGNPYNGGKTLHSNNAAAGWDLEFEVVVTTDTGPEPVGTITLGVASGGGVGLSWTTANGQTYNVETNADLMAPNWRIFDTIIGDGGGVSVTGTTTQLQLFYRVTSD